MINQICSQCSELTGPAARCECCGGDPAAAEVVCFDCGGTQHIARPGYHHWDHEWDQCERCAHSGRPGYVEAPFILEHDAHAKRAYWMDCPLSEIPLRAPFKELREVEPRWWAESRAKLTPQPWHCSCPSCGHWDALAWQGYPDNVRCSFCHAKIDLREALRSLQDWSLIPLVPAGLSAGGEA